MSAAREGGPPEEAPKLWWMRLKALMSSAIAMTILVMIAGFIIGRVSTGTNVSPTHGKFAKQTELITHPSCSRPPTFARENKTDPLAHLWINRPDVMKELDAAYEDSQSGMRFYIVLGGAGTGKSASILSWLNGRENVISLSCDRDLGGENIWSEIAEQNLGGCSIASAKKYVESTRPIIHLQVNGKTKEERQAGSAFVRSIGRKYCRFAFIILDLSPRSVDVGQLFNQGDRFRTVPISEFSVAEATQYLDRAGSHSSSSVWIPQGANKTEVITNITSFLIGRNPLQLRTMIVENRTFESIHKQYRVHGLGAEEHLAKMTPKERAVIRSLAMTGYDAGIAWNGAVVLSHELHLFPMLRPAYSPHGDWRLFFSSVRDHVVYKLAVEKMPKSAFVELTRVFVAPSKNGMAPFPVTPATNDIGSLKKAIKPTWDPMEQAF